MQVICETNSLDAAAVIPDRAMHKFHVIVATMGRIMELLQRNWWVKVEHIYREVNTCADFLAKFCLKHCFGLQIL